MSKTVTRMILIAAKNTPREKLVKDAIIAGSRYLNHPCEDSWKEFCTETLLITLAEAFSNDSLEQAVAKLDRGEEMQAMYNSFKDLKDSTGL